MTLPPLHLPLISAGFFGGVVARMLDFVALRIRRSDQGMAPSLSPDLRAQTVALHRRLAVLTREFHRLAELARQGRLRVYPDRASPVTRDDGAGRGQDADASGHRARGEPATSPASAFDQSHGVPQGPTLPAVATRGFGWMLGFVPAEHGPALAALLSNPEMVSLIQASPAVARLLRPLCRGLGVTPAEGVFPAPRRRRRARPDAPTQPGPGPGPDDAGERSAAPVTSCTQGEPGDAPSRVVHAPRRPLADAVMSPQARDCWWAERRAAGPGAAVVLTPVRADARARGRCANC